MTTKEVLNISQCCRICMICEDNMTNLFEVSIDPYQKTLVNILMECGIVFVRHTTLPQLICSSCINCARTVYDFYRRCEESERCWMRRVDTDYKDTGELKCDFLQKFEIVNDDDSMIHKDSESLSDVQQEDIFQSTEPNNYDTKKLKIGNHENDALEEPLSYLMIKMEDNESIKSMEETVCPGNVKAVKSEDDSSESDDLIQKRRKTSKRIRDKLKKNKKMKVRNKNNINAVHNAVQLNSDASRQYQCEYCEKTFMRSYVLNRHLLSHGEERQHSCPHCDKSFKRTDHLKIHIMRMHERRQHKCLDCNKEYTNAKQLENHKLQRHLGGVSGSSNNGKLYTCEQCGKEFRYEMRLRRHVAEEHGSQRLYTCKGCVLQFATKEECDAHMKQELHYKTQMCPECGKCFGTTNNLRVHMLRHRGAKPFKCKYCEKGFLRRADLKIHERYHTNEKSHFCEQCGRGFQRRCTLIIHMRTHTGEKPYKCPYCDQAFSQRQDMKAHIRRHTGDLLRCEVCGAGFLQAYTLRQHKLAEHNIMEESIIKRLVKVNETKSSADVS